MTANFEIIDAKLISLGVTRMFEEHSEEEVRALEKKYEFILPEEYGMFLQKYGALDSEKMLGFMPKITYPWSSEGTPVVLLNFYALEEDEDEYSLEKMIERYSGRMPESLMPIGDFPGGDQLCLGIDNQVYGKVFLWDHENEYMEYTSEDHLWWNVHETADSFTSFIMNLQAIEETPSDTSGIVSEHMSDEFLALIQKYKDNKK